MEPIELPSLPQRIREILKICQSEPIKRRTMTFLVMYDIEDDSVRRYIAKYLEKKGCIRIQKSIFIADLPFQDFEEIHQKLKEVNELYENHDSIILFPVSIDEIRAMKIIGKNLDLSIIRDNPKVLFF